VGPAASKMIVAASFALLVFWWAIPISICIGVFYLRKGRLPYPWD
jgi:hypothetical protein